MFDPRNNLANEVSSQLIAHFGDKGCSRQLIVPCRNATPGSRRRLRQSRSLAARTSDSRGALAYPGAGAGDKLVGKD